MVYSLINNCPRLFLCLNAMLLFWQHLLIKDIALQIPIPGRVLLLQSVPNDQVLFTSGYHPSPSNFKVWARISVKKSKKRTGFRIEGD